MCVDALYCVSAACVAVLARGVWRVRGFRLATYGSPRRNACVSWDVPVVWARVDVSCACQCMQGCPRLDDLPPSVSLHQHLLIISCVCSPALSIDGSHRVLFLSISPSISPEWDAGRWCSRRRPLRQRLLPAIRGLRLAANRITVCLTSSTRLFLFHNPHPRSRCVASLDSVFFMPLSPSRPLFFSLCLPLPPPTPVKARHTHTPPDACRATRVDLSSCSPGPVRVKCVLLTFFAWAGLSRGQDLACATPVEMQ